MAEYHVGCGAFGIYAGTLNHKSNICGKTNLKLQMKQLELLEIIW